MFGRRSNAQSTSESATSDTNSAGTSAGKGRPTPTRKEAEAARKQALKVPRDPKAAKAAERERARETRQRQMEALRGGDERYLPARDQGADRKYAREWVDSRFQLAAYFLPFALLILLTGILPLNKTTASYVRSIEFVLLIGMLVTTGLTYVLLGNALKKQFPDPIDRKGAAWYGTMRSTLPKRFRQPRPTVKYGGEPLSPKPTKPTKDAS